MGLFDKFSKMIKSDRSKSSGRSDGISSFSLSEKDIRAIRKVMEKTCWNSYDAFCHMYDISQRTGNSFSEISKNSLWTEYQNDRAAMLVGRIPFREDIPAPVAKEEFIDLFYSDRQKRAVRDLRSGILTCQTLEDFFEIEFPPELETDGDVLSKTAFKLGYGSTKGGNLLFCGAKKYIEADRLKRNMPACVISYPFYRKYVEAVGIPFVPRTNIRSYIIDMAHIWRNNFDARVVGISGSVGKTTTTGMIGAVSEAAKNTHRIKGNQNITWQVSDFILRLKKEHEVFVQECSGSYKGQLEGTANALEPDIYVLTNVGNGHIGNFDGMQERLLYEKTALDRNAAPGATGIINWDDPLLKKVPYCHRIRSFAIKDPEADYFAENIETGSGKISFDVVEKDYADTTHIELNVFGTHNVYNALAAFAVGVELGIDREVIAGALAGFATEGARQNMVNYGGHMLFIDCLSATEESMRSAIQTATTIDVEEGCKKHIVLGDVTASLGEQAEAVHRRIGIMVSEIGAADEFIFYGSDMRYAYEEALSRGVVCRYTGDMGELEKWLREETGPGDLILIKAGHAAKCSWVVDDLYGTDLYVNDKFTINDPIIESERCKYKCIPDYGATLISSAKAVRKIRVPEKIDDYKVRGIGSGAFRKSALEEFSSNTSLVCIGESAFENCDRLDTVRLPDTLLYIGPKAFAGCSNLKKVDLSAGCVTIESKAFSGCSALNEVIMPDSLCSASDSAFDGDCKALFKCPKGSYASEWAETMGFRFEEI